MTTVSSALKMHDMMTGPLKSLTNGMNMLISTMQSMQNTTERNTRVDRQLAAAKAQITAAENQLNNAIEESTREQNKFNRSVRSGGRETNKLVDTVKRLAATYLTIQGAKTLLGGTIGGSMEQQKMLDMLIARTGDAELGTAMFQKFKAEALAAGQDVTKSLQGTLSFFSTTQDVEHLTKLNNLTQRLNAFDSAGNGIEGAAFALKEAMSGDIVSLAERFNMSKTDIRAFKVDEYGKAGDMENFIKAFDKLLEKQRMGQDAFEKMMASPAKQMEQLGNNARSAFADAGNAAVQHLLPVITQLNENFKSGKYKGFFDGLSQGLEWVIKKGIWLFEVFNKIYTFCADNWPLVEAIIWGVVSAVGAWTLAQWALNIALAANPVGLIILAAAALIGIIIALVRWLINLWNKNDEFAAGMMRAWNSILNFFDQIPVYFTRIGYGIQDAFYDAKVGSLKMMEDLVNGTIDHLNSLITKLNKLPYVQLDYIDGVQFSAASQIEAEAARQAGQAKIASMEAEAAAKAAQRENDVIKKIDARKDKRAEQEKKLAAEEEKYKNYQFPKGSGASNITVEEPKKKKIDKVGQVDKVKGKVDISSEDLKVMRDIAEMKNIQNFVTLKPTVSVKTGNINNSGDLDSIVTKISTQLENDMAASAKGVYGNG